MPVMKYAFSKLNIAAWTFVYISFVNEEGTVLPVRECGSGDSDVDDDDNPS
jgi:hypothetical protein